MIEKTVFFSFLATLFLFSAVAQAEDDFDVCRVFMAESPWTFLGQIYKDSNGAYVSSTSSGQSTTLRKNSELEFKDYAFIRVKVGAKSEIEQTREVWSLKPDVQGTYLLSPSNTAESKESVPYVLIPGTKDASFCEKLVKRFSEALIVDRVFSCLKEANLLVSLTVQDKILELEEKIHKLEQEKENKKPPSTLDYFDPWWSPEQ